MNREDNGSTRWADLAAVWGASTVALAAVTLAVVAVAHLS
jgi:hypothetical protein